MARRLALAAGVCVATACAGAPSGSPETAAPSPTAENALASGRIITLEVGELVVSAQEKLGRQPPDEQGALADLERILTREKPNAYELGVVLFMSGGVRFQLGDSQGALADWRRALAEGDLDRNQRLNLMYDVGQLHLAEGDYREAVDGIEEWIRAGGQPNDGVHLNLVAAYVELGEWENALRHGRAAYEIADPRQKKHYDTLAYLYGEMGMTEEREAILREADELDVGAAASGDDACARPIVRMPPSYPIRAFELGLTGSCDLRFDIEPDGSVRLDSIEAACTNDVFKDAAVTALSGFRYAARDPSDEPAACTDLETTFEFHIEN